MSRHTEPMTDAYMLGQRMRNAARTKCKIEQLGTAYLLHPDNAITAEGYRKSRLPRIEVIDTRSVRGRVICTMGAFEGEFAKICERNDAELEQFEHDLMAQHGWRAGLLPHEGGAQ